jgi:hypothetical protein
VRRSLFEDHRAGVGEGCDTDGEERAGGDDLEHRVAGDLGGGDHADEADHRLPGGTALRGMLAHPTTITGQWALWATRSAVEPSR